MMVVQCVCLATMVIPMHVLCDNGRPMHVPGDKEHYIGRPMRVLVKWSSPPTRAESTQAYSHQIKGEASQSQDIIIMGDLWRQLAWCEYRVSLMYCQGRRPSFS
jgi:hypothetical protein